MSLGGDHIFDVDIDQFLWDAEKHTLSGLRRNLNMNWDRSVSPSSLLLRIRGRQRELVFRCTFIDLEKDAYFFRLIQEHSNIAPEYDHITVIVYR